MILRLRPGRTQPKEQRRRRVQRGRTSWKGFEGERKQLQQLARAYRQADRQLEEYCVTHNMSSDMAFQATQHARCHPDIPSSPAAHEAAQAQLALEQLHRHLVQRGLNYHLVRREWAAILSPVEANHCKELVQEERLRDVEDGVEAL